MINEASEQVYAFRETESGKKGETKSALFFFISVLAHETGSISAVQIDCTNYVLAFITSFDLHFINGFWGAF